MRTLQGTNVDMKSASQSVLASPADCLAAAQADAQRMFGDGPVPMWRPATRWGRWVAGAAVGAVLGGVLWGWAAHVPAPAGAGTVAVGAAAPPGTAKSAAPPKRVNPTEPAAASAADQRGVCEAAGCGWKAWSGPIAAGVAPAQSDPDAWALHPEPVQMAALPGFTGLVNVPEVPDEGDATPGVEVSVEDVPAPAVEE